MPELQPPREMGGPPPGGPPPGRPSPGGPTGKPPERPPEGEEGGELEKLKMELSELRQVVGTLMDAVLGGTQEQGPPGGPPPGGPPPGAQGPPPGGPGGGMPPGGPTR